MKTLSKVPVTYKKVQYIPKEMEQGVLYISDEYNAINHLCLCGCGVPAPIRIGPDWWQYSINSKDQISITPSLLHRFSCQSHYIITNGVANFV